MSAQRSFLQICQNVKQLFFAFKSEVCFEALWKCKALGVLSTPYHLSESGIWKAKDVSVSGRWLLLLQSCHPALCLPPMGESVLHHAGSRGFPKGGDLRNPSLAFGAQVGFLPSHLIWLRKGKNKVEFQFEWSLSGTLTVSSSSGDIFIEFSVWKIAPY